jgi:hypothetical protein
MEAIQDGDPKRLMRFVERTSFLALPGIGASGVKMTGEYMDPTRRPYKEPGDAIKRAIPKLSEMVRPMYSWDGNPVLVNRFQGRQTLPFVDNPYYKDDPVRDELVKIGAPISATRDYIRGPEILPGSPPVKIYYNDDEWDFYHKIIREGYIKGETKIIPLRQVIEQAMASPRYKKAKSANTKRAIVSVIFENWHSMARKITVANTDMGARLQKAVQAQATAIKKAEGM